MCNWADTGKDVFGRKGNDSGRGDFNVFYCHGVVGNGGGFLVYYLVKSREVGLFSFSGLVLGLQYTSE